MNHGSNHFIPWLRTQLDEQKYDGCTWVNKDEDIYKIAWPRANADTDVHRSLGVMYAWYTHKFGDSRLGIQPTAVKGNFRSCLNSKRKEIAQLHEHREGNITWKVMRFQRLPPSEGKVKKSNKKHRQQRPSSEQLISKQEVVSPHPSPVYSPGYSPGYTSDVLMYGSPVQYQGPSNSHTNSNMATSPAQTPYYVYNGPSDPASPPAPEEVVMQPHALFPEWLTVQQLSNNQYTNLRVEVYHKGAMIGSQMFPNMENKTLHIFYHKQQRQKALWAPVDVFAPDCTEFPIMFTPAPDTSDELKMIGKYFSPGVIVNCDSNANIGVQRVSPSHIYYSNPQEKHWIKLEKPQREPNTNNVIDVPPQRVFGYQEYIYLGEVWAGAKDQGHEPHVQYLPYQILMTIGEQPSPEYGFNDCQLGIKIIHSKAESFYINRIKKFLPSDGPTLKVSSDMAALSIDEDWGDFLRHAYNLDGTVDVAHELDELLQTNKLQMLTDMDI